MERVATCLGLKEARAVLSSWYPRWKGLLERGHGIFLTVDQRNKSQVSC